MPLSSSLTVLIRTVLPASWALLLPVVLIVRVPDPFEPVRRLLLVGLGILLLLSITLYVRLKDVHADAEGLVVSNGRASARVPWAQVAAIEKPWWGREAFARIELRTPTTFGTSILFMLSFAPFTRWRDHPSVQAVSDRVTASRQPGDAPGARRAR